MERVFKIKTRCDRNPQELYPSERRYSASIVLGLSVVYLILMLFSLLMGVLILHKMTMHDHILMDCQSNCTQQPINETVGEMQSENVTQNDDTRLMRKVERDWMLTEDDDHYFVNVPALVSAVCFMMSLGTFMTFFTGILAWKRWYVDHHISFFFITSIFSILTSSVALIVTLISFNSSLHKPHASPLTFSVELNIIIASVIILIWSILSSNLAYKGMKNNYPDDMVITKGGGKVEVKTVFKGNIKNGTLPVDILEQIPKSKKWNLNKKENDSLPKAESNFEYQQRVNNFITSSTEVSEKEVDIKK
ncbi:uncharacterized protein LOC109602189 [Aethina tumida]|uniref:uncharacterized protein LOC109602189 n=1 Tax=Aethina tumida TaxID=116153 RepID=UPI00096AF69F|nr:uncharacterized protein LOC109602189 [Aethina tumida]